MARAQPSIFAIKGNALDDGPGIRSVVFFKGCPLSCIWCHNPEGKRREVELSFSAKTCVGCDTCLAVCPEQALNRADPFFVDRARCTMCLRCAEACPSGALSQVGKQMSPAEVVRTVLRDSPFYAVSGGGVTLSGGEPTLFLDFAGELLQALKAEGVHTLLETCGLFSYPAFARKLYPWLDLIYFDLKLIDAEAHTRYCGVPNQVILDNFRRLARRMQAGGVRVVPRIPLIPAITDTEENLQAVAAFLAACELSQIVVLPYHPLWQEKEQMLGIEAAAGGNGLQSWPGKQQVVEAKAILARSGVRALSEGEMEEMSDARWPT